MKSLRLRKNNLKTLTNVNKYVKKYERKMKRVEIIRRTTCSATAIIILT